MKFYPITLTPEEWEQLEPKDPDIIYRVENPSTIEKVISYCLDPFIGNDYNPKSEYGIGRKNMAEEILELIEKDLNVKFR